MKKILLGTTTLIGAASLFAGAALAETPKVTVGGDADFQMGWVNEDLDAGLRNHAFRSVTELKFRVDGKSDAGLGYGGGVDLSADTSAQISQPANANRTFIYVDGNWGRFEMGSDVGAQQTMKVDTTNIARATGGQDWRRFVNTGTGGTNIYYGAPVLDIQYGAVGLGLFGNEYDENVNKVTYYSPKFSGFQLGVSYMPDSLSTGQVVNRVENAVTVAGSGAPAAAGAQATFDNVWTGGISYDGKWDQVGIALAATAEHGDSTTVAGGAAAQLEDLRTWNLGGKFSYMGFAVAGSYGNIGDSGRLVAVANDDTTYWTLGGAYETGPFGASITWFNSEREIGAAAGTNELTNWSFGVDYKLAPGLTPYAEVTWSEQDSPTAALDNDATVFIAGTQLSF